MTTTPKLPVRDICVFTGDLARAVAFWRDTVGLIPRQINDHFADFETGGARIAFWDRKHFAAHIGLSPGASADGVMVAVEYEDSAALDAAFQALSARGVVFAGPPRLYDWGAHACYFADPDGTIVELYSFASRPG